MKLTKKNTIAAAVVLVCLLVGVDLTVLEHSNVRAALDKAQEVVGGLLGEEEAETPATTEESPATDAVKEDSAE